jgi:hypothetical protein
MLWHQGVLIERVRLLVQLPCDTSRSLGRFRVVQRHPLAVGVKETEIVLSVGVSLFGLQTEFGKGEGRKGLKSLFPAIASKISSRVSLANALEIFSILALSRRCLVTVRRPEGASRVAKT